MSRLPRKFLVVKNQSERYEIMCEIGDRTYTAEVSDDNGSAFLSRVYDIYLEMIVQHGIANPRLRRVAP